MLLTTHDIMSDRVRVNTAIVLQPLEKSATTTTKTASFELDSTQSILQLVDLCLKPHLAAQSIPAPDLRLWPTAVFQQDPLFASDLSNVASLQTKAMQAFTLLDGTALNQFQLKQLTRPAWSQQDSPHPGQPSASAIIHLIVFPDALHTGSTSARATAAAAEAPPPTEPSLQQDTTSASVGVPPSLQHHQGSISIPRPLPQTNSAAGPSPQNHLPFLQYLSMTQPPATQPAMDHHHHQQHHALPPYLQSMPLPGYAQSNARSCPIDLAFLRGVPVLISTSCARSDVNANLDPLLAAMPPFLRPNMNMPLQSSQSSATSDTNSLRSSLGMPSTDSRQDIHIGSSIAAHHQNNSHSTNNSHNNNGLVRPITDEEEYQQPSAKRPRTSEGSTPSSTQRRNSTKTDGPRYTCEERHETDEHSLCGASFARPYDVSSLSGVSSRQEPQRC